MKPKTPMVLSLVLAATSLCFVSRAQERGRARRSPPAFHAHPPGAHPRGPSLRSHETRVLAPRTVVHGRTGWPHWRHPELVRPDYYWDWQRVHTVACVAEDSYGDQYQVSEARPRYDVDAMTDIEDDALDRCYVESGQDPNCVLVTCTHL